jgi:hypothetical protein
MKSDITRPLNALSQALWHFAEGLFCFLKYFIRKAGFLKFFLS